MTCRSRTLVTAIALLAVPFVAAPAQQATTAGRPGWLPDGPVRISGVTAAQRADAVARLEAIKRILLQVPELARPNGFEVMADMYGGARMLGPGGTERPGNVIEYRLRLWLFYPSKAAAGEGCNCIWVAVNSAGFHGSDAIPDEQGRAIYIESEQGDAIPGAARAFGRLSPNERSITDVLVAPPGDLPWKRVSREDYYRAVIFNREGKDGAKLAEQQKSFAKTPYREWMEASEQRRKNREASLEAMAQSQSAADVAKARKLLEDTEREVTEKLRSSENEHKQRQEEGSARVTALSDALRAELEAMTPAERAMPALVDKRLSEGPSATGWRMGTDEAPHVQRILTPNYDFWRARRSPVEPRSITVHLGASLTGQRPPVHNAIWQTYNKLDWAALAKLLDASP